jgi:predicted dehydrogenase
VTLDRLLVVGFGSIGRRHARLARQLLPHAEITVLRHRACADLAGTGVDRCVTTLGEAMAHRPQAAVIASPASRHLEAALPLARAGVHLLVEKPIATEDGKVGELIATARTHRVALMTGYNLRFLPSLQRFRELIQARSTGTVFSVHAEVGQYLPSWRPGSDYRESVSARAELGGGVLLELSHEIDYLRWLFGEVDWVCAVERRQSELEIDVPDTALLTLGFKAERGERAVVASLALDLLRHDTTRRCTVIGEHATLRWDAISGTVERFAAGGTSWECLASHPPARDESYLAEWRHFLACIQSGDAPLIGGEDGLAALMVVQAARASSDEGKTMPVPRVQIAQPQVSEKTCPSSP